MVTFTSSMDTGTSDYASVVTDLPLLAAGSVRGPISCRARAIPFVRNERDQYRADARHFRHHDDILDRVTVTIYEEDGVTPISDSDADGVPDTGVLACGASDPIVIEVLVPSDADPDSLEVTWSQGHRTSTRAVSDTRR